MKKKVLFISCWNPRPGYPNHGSFIRKHAHALQQAGHPLLFLAVNIFHGRSLYTKTRERKIEDGIDVMTINIRSRLWKFIYNFYPLARLLLQKELRHIAQAEHIDIVVSNVAHPAAVLGETLAKAHPLPHIVIEHYSKAKYNLKHLLFRHTQRRIYAEAALVVAVSAFLKDTIQQYVPRAHIQVIPNVIDTHLFTYTKAKKQEEIKFLAIAHWNQTKRRVKRPELMIESLRMLKQQQPHLRFAIEFIGSGNLLAQMQALCTKYGIRALFSGHQSPAQIAQTLHQSSFLLHASTIETFSIVIAEALSCGVPVVASRVGAVPYLVNDTNGILTENTIESWHIAIQQALQTDFDHQSIAESIKGKYSYENVGKTMSLAIETSLNEARA